MIFSAMLNIFLLRTRKSTKADAKERENMLMINIILVEYDDGWTLDVVRAQCMLICQHIFINERLRNLWPRLLDSK